MIARRISERQHGVSVLSLREKRALGIKKHRLVASNGSPPMGSKANTVLKRRANWCCGNLRQNYRRILGRLVEPHGKYSGWTCSSQNQTICPTFSATIILRCLKATPMSHLGALPENRCERRFSRTIRKKSGGSWSRLRSVNPAV